MRTWNQPSPSPNFNISVPAGIVLITLDVIFGASLKNALLFNTTGTGSGSGAGSADCSGTSGCCCCGISAPGSSGLGVSSVMEAAAFREVYYDDNE